jgi:hypothetical protein
VFGKKESLIILSQYQSIFPQRQEKLFKPQPEYLVIQLGSYVVHATYSYCKNLFEVTGFIDD